MAEVTAMRSNATPFPVYGLPWTVVFPLLDADGDPVTGATTPDAEVSKNGDTFADCTNESTEIATSSGIYYLTLTGTEMTADVVAVQAKSATAGMKTTVITLYPRKLVAIRAGTCADDGSGTSTIVLDSGASAVDDFYNGMIVAGVLDSNTEVRMITDYTGSTKTASVTPDFVTAPDADDTFTIYRVEGAQIQQSNLTTWNGTAVASPDTAGYPKVTIKSGTGTGELNLSSGATDANVTKNAGTAITSASGIQEVKVASIAANAITAASAAADFSQEIRSELDSNSTMLAAIAGYIDTEVAAIKAKTDGLTFTVANQVDVNVKSNAGTAITAASGIQEVKVASIANNAVSAASLAADAGAEIADAFLDRDMSTGTDSGSTTVRTPRQALRFLRNKWDVSGGTLTVKKEDDSTDSWTSTVTTDAAADPIIGNDPAGP